ncbi:Imm21 family immunity protein [Microtetraspora malaysiensis]
MKPWGDYGRACAVEGYIGLVAVGAQQALVLGPPRSVCRAQSRRNS